jgi:uncharacterized protein YndB with AHSA1/START domain
MTIEQLPSPDTELRLAGDFYDFSPERLFAYWTRPDLAPQWWPTLAEVTPGVGGGYVFSFPKIPKTLRGGYTVFEPGRALSFTWAWDGDPPHEPPITVALTFAPLATSHGTRLTLMQGPYAETPADQELRQSHLEGWQYFLGRLQRLSPAADWTGGMDRELDEE